MVHSRQGRDLDLIHEKSHLLKRERIGLGLRGVFERICNKRQGGGEFVCGEHKNLCAKSVRKVSTYVHT